MFGMGVAIFASSLYQSFVLPFVFMGIGACVADIFSVLKINYNIKLFNKLNDDDKKRFESFPIYNLFDSN